MKQRALPNIIIFKEFRFQRYLAEQLHWITESWQQKLKIQEKVFFPFSLSQLEVNSTVRNTVLNKTWVIIIAMRRSNNKTCFSFYWFFSGNGGLTQLSEVSYTLISQNQIKPRVTRKKISEKRNTSTINTSRKDKSLNICFALHEFAFWIHSC